VENFDKKQCFSTRFLRLKSLKLVAVSFNHNFGYNDKNIVKNVDFTSWLHGIFGNNQQIMLVPSMVVLAKYSKD
jgi:hypothetical protein